MKNINVTLKYTEIKINNKKVKVLHGEPALVFGKLRVDADKGAIKRITLKKKHLKAKDKNNFDIVREM